MSMLSTRPIDQSDLSACRALLKGGSRTFFAASHVLPRRVSDPATALYAFCRLADDAVDLEGGKLAALARLRDRLDRAYAGHPVSMPADRAFADVVARFAIPRALPEALLQGLEWDVCGRRYESIEDLRAYAARVAGAVGAMMSLVMGERAPDVVSRACDLGIAMQLTNVARDVGEDARAGRLYLPLMWMRNAGIDPNAWLARPEFDARLAAIIQRLLNHADELYERARAGISKLPADCRPGIHAARLLYREIGHEVARRDFDSVSQRAVVGVQRRVWLLGCAVAASPWPRSDHAPALAEAAFLVESVLVAGAASSASRRGISERLEARVVWLINLFERLERRQQLGSTGS
jgi:phytoene synthase